MSHWKFAGGYAYITSSGKRGWAKTLSGVPASAKGGKTTTTRRKKTTAGKRKKQARRVARKSFGNMSIKGVVLGGALLAGVKTVVRQMAPQLGAYTPGASALGAGVAASAIGLPGKSLKTFGLIDIASEGIIDLVNPGGMVTLPGIPGAKATGGYQY